jgi:drug/metabolite transporter (DMT)-like permease
VFIALGAVYLIWGSTYLGIRFALEGFPPYMLGALRFVVAGAGLYTFLRIRGMRRPTLVEWQGSALLGALMLVLGFGGVTFAEQYVSSGLTALAVGAMPLWAALFAGLFGRWPVKIESLGLVLGFTGLIILNLSGGLRASPTGAVVLLISPACWAMGSVLSGRLRLPPGLMASAAEMLCGGVFMAAISLLRGERLHHMPSPHATLSLAYLIVFGSIVAFSAYLFLLGRVRPSLATSYAYVNPVVAMGVGVWLGGEHTSGAAILATPIILAGVVIVLIGQQRR